MLLIQEVHLKIIETEVPQYENKKDKTDSLWLRGKYLLDNGSIAINYNHSEDKDYYTGSLSKEQFDKNPRTSRFLEWLYLWYKMILSTLNTIKK